MVGLCNWHVICASPYWGDKIAEAKNENISIYKQITLYGHGRNLRPSLSWSDKPFQNICPKITQPAKMSFLPFARFLLSISLHLLPWPKPPLLKALCHCQCHNNNSLCTQPQTIHHDPHKQTRQSTKCSRQRTTTDPSWNRNSSESVLGSWARFSLWDPFWQSVGLQNWWLWRQNWMFPPR